MSTTTREDRMLARKRQIDAERKAQAILRNPANVQKRQNMAAILAVAGAKSPAITPNKEA